ncbi:Fructose-1,6-bisphosphatase class 3 [Frankliniella fusca]|uniref:Fructose-1,6-bisphosphatase class 3 n=1 Tax=Frankliniella fusca TaxID=407009 RepID=A0AAE1HV54_9NEOP|nr:Fructose-1,6-bisphosphatase class 3 [Frankliniella fusca]
MLDSPGPGTTESPWDPADSRKVALAALAALVLGAGAAAGADVCGGHVGQVCTSCDRLAVCARLDGVNVIPVVNMACPAYAPFCSRGRCARYMDPNNPCHVAPEPSPSFRCPAGFEGYLPDPSSCSRYHYCGAGGVAWDYECRIALNTVYDHARAGCSPRGQVACQTCGREAYSLYAADNTIAFSCPRSGQPEVMVCPPNHRLDLEAGGDPPRCARFCPREGRQAASDDPSFTLYYECLASPDGELGAPVLKACPEGTAFSPSLERCVTRHSSE